MKPAMWRSRTFWAAGTTPGPNTWHNIRLIIHVQYALLIAITVSGNISRTYWGATNPDVSSLGFVWNPITTGDPVLLFAKLSTPNLEGWFLRSKPSWIWRCSLSMCLWGGRWCFSVLLYTGSSTSVRFIDANKLLGDCFAIWETNVGLWWEKFWLIKSEVSLWLCPLGKPDSIDKYTRRNSDLE